MGRYVLNKVLIAIATVFVLATATFFLMKLIPGDPFANLKTKAAVQEKQREYYGLDRPVAEQYVRYMGNLLRGDLGWSLKKAGRSVVDIIREGFPVSAKLGLTSLLNLDGGGSTEMWFDGHVVNRLSDGRERKMPYGLMVLK
jgi:oligopeptide transport system permease protein